MPTTGDLAGCLGPEASRHPISLYFHIPFCTKKCPYCHFFVLPDKTAYHKTLIEALKLDMDRWADSLKNRPLASIYFGGGTPSLLAPEEISALLDHLANYAELDLSSTEVTLEANPETVTLSKMEAFRAAGVNRVSLGVQALDGGLLHVLGRTHGTDQAVHAVEAVYKAGISNISIDLMYDLPGQSVAQWEKTLRSAVKLPITHLSLYNLTIEPHTVFFKYQEQLARQLPDGEASAAMYRLAQDMLREAGLAQYEISAFARDHRHSRHNTGYWTGRDFLGFGPSAFSYLRGERFKAIANLNRYASLLKEGKAPIEFREKLTGPNRRKELLAINLRLTEGVDLGAFEQSHGKLEPEITECLGALAEKGFLQIQGSRAALTQKGVLFYDTVAVEII